VALPEVQPADSPNGAVSDPLQRLEPSFKWLALILRQVQAHAQVVAEVWGYQPQGQFRPTDSSDERHKNVQPTHFHSLAGPLSRVKEGDRCGEAIRP
jgi:hypothetical protein